VGIFFLMTYVLVRATNIMARGLYCIYATDGVQGFVKENNNSTQAGTQDSKNARLA
jgi:hypothetical protein